MIEAKMKPLPFALAQAGVFTFSHVLAGSYTYWPELFPVTAWFFPPEDHESDPT